MATKNLFLQTPSAGDIQDIYKEGAESISRLSLPSFPTPHTPPARTPRQPTNSQQGYTPEFEVAVSQVLAHEGGFTPSDGNSGAPANFGINQAHNPDVDVRNITQDDAKAIYKSRYWDAIGGDNLPPELQGTALDAAVNQGPGNARKWLQESGGDVAKFNQLRRQHYENLAAKPEFSRFRNTWLRRLSSYENAGSQSVPGKIGLGGNPADLQARLDAEEPGRYQVLSPEEARRLQLQSELDSEEPGRFQVLRPSEVDTLPDSALTSFMQQQPAGEQPSTGGILLESLKSGSINVASSIASFPEAVLRSTEGALASLDRVGRALGLPEWMLERKYIGPNDIVAPLVRGKNFGSYRMAGANDIADMIKNAGKTVENPKQAQAIQQIAAQADQALTSALNTGDLSGAIGIISNPDAWAVAFGQAAPSLIAAMVGGLPLILALEGGNAAAEVREFEEKGGKVGDIQAANAIMQTAAVNTLLEKLGLDAVMGRLPAPLRQRLIGETVQGLKGRLMRAGTGAVIGGIGETGTEALQTVNENLAKRNYNADQSLSEGVLLSAMGGGAAGASVGGVRGGLSGPQPAAQTPTQPAADTATPADASAAPPSTTPSEPSGPITRAMKKATAPETVPGTEVQPEPVQPEQAPAQQDMPRVRLTAENGDSIEGVAEQMGQDGSARVLGDDGQLYVIGPDDGVMIEPIVDQTQQPVTQETANDGQPTVDNLSVPDDSTPGGQDIAQPGANQPAGSALPEAPVSGSGTERAGAAIDAATVGENTTGAGHATDGQPALTGNPLQDNPASWVIRNKETGAVVGETFDRAKVDALNTDKYEAVPAYQHLAELNDPNSKARKRAEGKPEQQTTEAPIVRTDGTPFKSESAARQAMKNRRLQGYEPVQVGQGWGLAPVSQQAEATATKPDLRGMINEAKQNRERIVSDVRKIVDEGQRLPVLKGKELTYVVHPSTKKPGSYQVTTYNDTGALGDTTVDNLDDIVSAIGSPNVRVLDLTEAEAALAKVAAAEGEYQAKRNAPKAKPAVTSTAREMTEEGRAKDGGPIMPGDKFRTLSGRETAPYPKQKSEKYASQWLIDNATAEAESRGDDFNARTFRSTSIQKGGGLTAADREGMLMYLFGEQPQVVPSILKPLAQGDMRPSSEKTGRTPESEYSLYRDRIIGDMSSDEMKALFRNAGVRSADAFGGLPIEDQAIAYGKFVADGGRRQAVPENYNEYVQEQESAAELRRRESNGEIAAVNGNPFKTEKAARTALNGLPESGEFSRESFGVYKKDGGFVLRRWSRDGMASGATDPNWVDQDAAGRSRSNARQEFMRQRGLVEDKFGNMVTPEEAERNNAEPDDDGEVEQSPAAKPEQTNKPARKSNNKVFTDEAAEKARALLRSKLSQLNSGIDPEVLQAGITLAGWHIENGARTFAAYAKSMINDMGEGVKPYLKSWYLGVKFDPRSAGMEGMSTAAEVEQANVDNLADDGADTGETDTVVTPAGREIEVRYRVMDVADLVTSNLDDGRVNQDYPKELQPRDRSRLASQAQITEIASRLNPRLLGENPSTTDGAPIVSRDGVVESGNGRTIAIRRAYAENMPSARAYRDWLAEQGYDVAGMKAPVLVRERVTEMSARELQDYTTESNERTTLAMSPTERAMSDAKNIGDIIGLYRGGDIPSAANRDFVRAFMETTVSQSDRGAMMDSDGILSQDGRRRIEAALLAAAYGNSDIVTDLFESSDSDIKAIGGALMDVAGVWAQMRSEAASGTISSSVDVTPNLMEAVAVVRRARGEGRPVVEFVNQDDFFAGGMDPVTVDFLKVFYRGDRFTRARGRDKVAEALADYVQQAQATQAGNNLFGEPEITGAEILRNTNERTRRQEGQGQEQQDIFAGTRTDDADTREPGREGQRPQSETPDETAPENGGRVNAPGSRQRVERDSEGEQATQSVVPEADDNDTGRTARVAGRAGQDADQQQRAGQRDQRLPDDGPATGGERSDQPVYRSDGQLQPESGATGSAERAGSRIDSVEGSAVEQERADAVIDDAAAPGADDLAERLAAQKKASNVKTKWGDKASIDAALPLLLPEQRDDVLKAEKRLANNNGILFTNGTGTGKTATGLGVIKRHINDGKDNIIVVVPSDKIASDWVKFAGMMGVDLKQLEDTTSNGKTGPVITTYANFGQNETLVQRDWDLVVADESHYLSSNEDGKDTAALEQLRALTGHHNGFFNWVRQRFPKEWKAYSDAMRARSQANGNPDIGPDRYATLEQAEQKAREKWAPIEQRERAKWDARWASQQGLPKTVFLSATPFAYAKNTDYAEGYLFHYVEPAQLKGSEGQGGGYNSGSPRDRFMMQQFGYRMRYNKLTAPEAGVDSQLMEQQFNEWLKSTGALSGRRLEVPFDYDRKFVLVDDAVGTKIDEGLKFLREAEDGKYRQVYDAVMSQFDYQRRMYLLESMKARAAVPIIREHLSRGRKVVVFHDFNKGGGFDPFQSALREIGDPDVKSLAREVLKMPMFKLDFSGLFSPIETMTQAFPDALFFNGTVPKAKRRANADLFNDDDSGRDLIVVQSDAGREGVSLHDTTGNHQRVEINLGMPVKPVAATQIEGRIYRTGQASDAVFRYLTTGTAWEASAFASKIAERASTAENLALGNEARGLRDAFIDAYQNADTFPASDADGKGGKDYDRKLSAAMSASPFDRAKTFYWAQQKNTKRRGQREGVDYYATPEPVGFKMVEWANVQPNDKALEPSAGHGAIARFFPELADVTMVEPSYELSQRAALANGNARIVNDTFEQLHINNKYDAIVMNPPYGSGGKTSTEHLAKAAKHLRNGGRIVALIPRGGQADKRLDAFLESEDAADLYTVARVNMPSVTFERAGTAVNTQILVLEKHANPEDAAQINQRNVDLSNAETINELFDRLENIGLPPRQQTSAPEPKVEIVEHTTGKGKVLRGVIRTDLTKDEAREIDPYTFRKKNAEGQTGWFIRAKHLDDGTKYSVAPQTETAAFKRWFGDSKVVDADGNPMVVYHGTQQDISAFNEDSGDKVDPGWLGRGFYFTSNPDTARYYATNARTDIGGGNVMPVYLSIKNPYYATIQDKENGALRSFGGKSEFAKARRAELIAEGYDGVILDFKKGGFSDELEIVAFRPEQIKSATGNIGTFDPANPDIRYSTTPDGKVQAEFGPVHTEYTDDPAAAIDRLMQDQTGEALVTHPELGDISLVYGDRNAGLAHIAQRRGDDFVSRIPGLIQNGRVYTKPNQGGRVFIGDDVNEASIRLDWNGEAKTWLVSAYEKYPDLKTGQPEQVSRRSQTVEQRSRGEAMDTEALQDSITTGIIGPVIARLIEHGTIVLHQNTKTLPKGVGRNVRGIQALTMPNGTIHMVADSLSPENARAVLLHEMFHKGGERAIGTAEWSKMMGRLGSLYRQSEQSSGKAREFFDRARARVAAAKQQGAVPTRMEVEEFGAYAIEEYETNRAGMPAAIRKWVEDLIGFVKAWVARKYGKQLGQVTPAQLSAIAKMALLDVAADRRGELFGPIGTLFSASSPVNSPAFRRWFGDSKVVDADGNPMVVYHVTDADFSEFDISKSKRAAFGAGFYFTRNLNSQKQQATVDGAVVMPVYLSIQNPASINDVRQAMEDIQAGRFTYEQQVERGKAVTENLISKGFDGVDVGDGDYVAFRPEQIKSATGNQGTFDPGNPDIRFSVAQPVKSPAFKNWFKKSAVVDEQGNPLKVYHGTNANFTQFDRGMVGSNTGMDNTGLGFFFIADRQLAEDFAQETTGGGRVIDAYLSIQKPMRLTREAIFSDRQQAPTLYEIFTGERLSPAEALGAINEEIGLGEFGDIAEAMSTQEARDILERDGYDGVISEFGNGNLEYVAFRPEQIKSASENEGTFDPENADIRYSVKPSEHFKDLSDKQKGFLNKIGPERLPKRLSDRWRQLTDSLGLRIRQAGVDRYAALLRNDKALYGEDTLEGSIASSAWVLARMSHSAGGAMSAMLNNGRIYLDPDEKVIDVREGTQGLRSVLQQLGTPQEIDRFMAWIAANRARKLYADGRENLFTEDEIEAGVKLSTGKTEDGKNRALMYSKAWRDFQQYRDDVLAIAEQSGTISKEQRETWSEEFYVPFYRVLDEESLGGPSSSSGLSRQQAYKRLKGGKQNLNDLLENTLLNFHHLIQTALKNQAARQAVDNAVALEIAEPTTESMRDKKLSTFVMEDGQKRWYDISDPLTFKALAALNSTGLNTPLMKAGRAFKRLFTNMTTITPQFMIANTLRDSLSAMATSPTSAVPFKNAVKGAAVYGNADNRAKMIASGGSFSFGHVYGQNADEIKASLKGTLRDARLLNNPSMIPSALMTAWRKWNQVTDFAENINRAGIWERNLSKGKLKAAFEARDLMDFSAHGEALTVRIMTDLVPFLNARIQGLDKLYRSGFKPGAKTLVGKGAKSDKLAFARFVAVTGALSVLSVLLYLNNMDDEEYRNLEDWQRDTYWFFRIGEAAFFIPKPFEVGAIATLAERAAEQFADPTVAGKKFAERLGHMLTDTFSLDLPQIIKPAYELSANRNTFTGRPIEDIGMQRLSPSLRVRPNTTRLSEGASRAMETVIGDSALSPVQIDHLIGAYLGQVGAGTAALADTLWRRAMGEQLPARRWDEYQPIRRFYRDLGVPAPYTRYATDFYNALKEADKAYANVQHLIKYQEFEKAGELQQKEGDKLAIRPFLNRVQRDLSKINAEMRQVQIDKEMSGEEKRVQLERLRSLKNMITEGIGKELENERVRARDAEREARP